MPQALSLGNGSLQVNIDENLQLRDIYFPFVGEENHSQYGWPHRIGIWVDNQFSWLDDDGWEIEITYKKQSMVGSSFAQNKELGIKLEFTDFIHSVHNIFGRQVVIINQREYEREIRIFFAYDLYLYGAKLRDTAQWEPDWNAILHYRKHRYFLAGGQWNEDEKGMNQFSVGKSNYQGQEGTWRDAEDGVLAGNQVEQGSVDFVTGFSSIVPPLKSRTLNHWVVAGEKYGEIDELRKRVMGNKFEELLRHTEIYWRNWVNLPKVELSGINKKTKELWLRSLLVLRTQIDNHGAIIASSDSDIMKFNRDSYAYCWMRDGSFTALTLAKIERCSLVVNYLEFCRESLTKEGFVLNKYISCGATGSCWHPKFVFGKRIHAIQEDETALIPLVLLELCKHGDHLDIAQRFWDSLIRPIADFMCSFIDPETNLLLPSYDPWEEHVGVWTYTTSTVIAGLEASAQIASWTGHSKLDKKYRKVAKNLKKSMIKNLWSPRYNRFLKGLELTSEGLVPNNVIDASLAHIWRLEVFPADDYHVIATMNSIRDNLSLKTGGIARYTNDYYQRTEYSPPNETGNPWIITTLWLADWYIEIAKSKSELKKAEALIQWSEECTTPSGLFPEQVEPTSKQPLSVAPLLWSHGTYLDTVIRYSKKYSSLKR